ncbi:hypothetical protein GRI43_11165 [Altererythrobacter luteolus]|uniref:Sulphotransferase Stf0 domain-containing protein n=1 Tax=Pontixanthobacter luteolus TaxID=295089 RepID=A0A6I4V6M3_9SPHN|nr:Stf0 family sulfotransferase [Pontixanthobacter luteolus]MXP47944.1 hypothetical protein [Pontixanthobacter luteolus]
MSAFHEQFSPSSDLANPVPIKRAVIIASTQRSGSSLLGHTLRDTGGFGVPLEYFNVQNLDYWRQRFSFSSINELLDHIERVRTSSNGIFAIKSHYFQLRNFGSISDLRLRYEDCRFIRIVRRDMLAQAISRTVAQQTGVWIAGQARSGEPHYDFKQIVDNLQTLSRQHEQWSLALAATGTPFLEVAHEDLIADPTAQVLRISEFCSVDPQSILMPSTPPIEAQENPRKSEWTERFVDEFDEKANAPLNGFLPAKDSLKDLARWSKSILKRKGPGEAWYRSPNLAS